jgi:brefeldin A-resistance guanine nucleotide exchange factor 1
MTFDFISYLVGGHAELMTSDNYAGILLLLDEFATVAGVVTEAHGQQRRKEPPLTAASYVPLLLSSS